MTRIQRARALRLGFILASLLCASVASAQRFEAPDVADSNGYRHGHATDPVAPSSLVVASETVKGCMSETSWEERVKGGWIAVCGDAWGHRLAVLDPAVARCDAKAALDYRLAELVGVDADAAWEDSYAACVGAP